MRKKSILLMVGINLGAAMIAVLAFGVWKRLNPNQVDRAQFETRTEGSITAGGFFQGTDDLGYVLAADKQVTAKKTAESRVLYDVTYTTGPDHFRIVPEARQAERCVLLFGDSFTFGEGVNDAETTAAQIVSQSKGRVAAKSFGIGGWGPHQFLAGLQSGRFQRAISCRPTEAVYLIISAQIGRAAGRGHWDTHGPRFRLRDGKPVRSGNFDNFDWSWRLLVGLSALSESEEDALTAALIAEGARELGRLYPGIRFYVFAWDDEMPGLLRQMADRGLDVRHLREIIPDYSLDKYLIAPPMEGHPNARAYERIAAYILKNE